jgi:hypothetical protein
MIEIKGVSYKMRYSLRALVIYEKLKENFVPGSLMDEIVLYYSVFMASNPEADIDFEAFFEALDNDLALLSSLRKWMRDKVEPIFEKDGSGDSKKKASPRKKSTIN